MFLSMGQNNVLTGLRLGLDISEPLASGVDGDQHLAGFAAEFIIEFVFDSALPRIIHPYRADDLCRQISIRVEALRLFLEMNALQVQ